MMRFIVPIVLLATAIGLFVVWTNPQYQGLKALQLKSAEYSDALSKAAQLRSIRDQLLSRRNTFNQSDLDRLQHALPDNVDNIRLIIDINNIAARHNISLTNIGVGAVSDASQPRSALAVGSSGDPVGSVVVNFSLSTDYDTFLAFLHDLEHSLRLVDVESISLKADQDGAAQYNLSIRTYWLH